MTQSKQPEPLNEKLYIRVTDSEKKAIQTLADAKGQTVSELIRNTLKRQIKKHQQQMP